MVDIREQYPLFPTARARDIAAELGIRYPMYVGTQVPFVVTPDFAVTLADAQGKRRIAIRTCKYEDELSDPNNGLAVLEKLELERAIWVDQGVTDWMIVTDQLMGAILKDNLDWLHKSAFSKFLQEWKWQWSGSTSEVATTSVWQLPATAAGTGPHVRLWTPPWHGQGKAKTVARAWAGILR